MAATQTKSNSNSNLRWILGILIMVALLASAFLAGRASVATVPSALPASVGPLGEQARREATDPFAMGPEDAQVVMVAFSDYRCPFCARHSRVTEQELIERYVESGQLRIEWRDLPIFGDASLLAARAGRAAAEQDLFWEYNQTIFAAAPESGHHDLTEPLLLEFAGQVGIPDLDKFENDMLSEQFDESIEADFMQAVSLGMTGTPSFVVNGHPVVGAQPTAVFTTMIDEALAGQ